MSTTLWRQWPRSVYNGLSARSPGVRKAPRRPHPVLRLEELECRLVPVTQVIHGAASQIVFLSPQVTSVTEGVPSEPITVQVLDADGNPLAGQTVGLSSSDSTGVFYDSTGAHTITSVTTTGASGEASFRYEDSTTGSVTLTASTGNLVQNDGFETGNFTGWTQGGNTGFTDVENPPNGPHSGSYAAELGPVGSLGYLTQNIATVAGQQYTFSWWLANDGGTPNEFQAWWNGAEIFDQTNMPAQGYTLYSFTETATSSSTAIQFGFRQDPAYFQLDDVAVDVAVSTTLSVNAPPVVATQPTSLTVNAGDSASFTAAASGTPNPSVQWYAAAPGGSFTPLSDTGVYSGTATPILSISNANGLDGYQYEAVFSNAAGSAPSDAAALTVASQLAISGPQTLTAGAPGEFTVQLEDSSGRPITSSIDDGDVINLATTSTSGAFSYSDVSGATLTIHLTAGSATFYYEDTAAGSPTLTATDTSHTALTAGTQTETVNPGEPYQLVFLEQAADATAGANILAATSSVADAASVVGTSPYVQVAIEDQYGNVVDADSSVVTISGAVATHSPSADAVSAGTLALVSSTPSPFDPASQLAEQAVDGIATFNDLIAGQVGTYTLTADDASDSVATAEPSGAFTISPGPASSITFSPTTTSLTAGAPSSSITLTVLDSEGNAVAGEKIDLTTSNPATGLFIDGSDAANRGKTITLTTGPDGTATFTYKDTLAGPVTLTAADDNPDLSNVTASQDDTVVAAAPAQLTFIQQPDNAVAGQPFGTDVKVKVVDSFGNPISGDQVTLAVASGPGASFDDPAAALSAVTDASGVADFSNLVLDDAGAYTLKATDALSAADGEPISGSSGLVVFPAFVALAPASGSAVAAPAAGATFVLTGSFSDLGPLAIQGAISLNVLINWGDGTAGQPDVTSGVVTNGGGGSFTISASHVYAAEGSFPVSVEVTAGGGELGVGALLNAVEVLPASSGSVDIVAGQPGLTVVQSVTDPSGVTSVIALSLGADDPAGGGVLAAPIQNFVPPATAGVGQAVASFEVRQFDLATDMDASALVTFIVPGKLPPGAKLFFDFNGREVLYVGSFSLRQEGNEYIVSMLLNSTSTPSLQELTGTVFTVAASTAGAVGVTAVSPAVASNASTAGVAVQAASFQSTSQLTLTLAASQAGQVSTSRSSLSAADGGGGDQPLTDAQAGDLLKFLFEKLDLTPKDLLHIRVEEIIRLWLGQVGLAPAGRAAGDPPDPAADRLAAQTFLFAKPEPAFGGEAPAAVPVVAVRTWAAARRATPDAPSGETPAYAWVIPVVGVGLGGLARKSKRKQALGRRM